jgi:hypothetical protein
LKYSSNVGEWKAFLFSGVYKIIIRKELYFYGTKLKKQTIMKKTICFSLFSLVAALVFSQQPAAKGSDQPNPQPQQVTIDKAPLYWCTECDYSSMKEGICPHHKITLVREGMYYCKGDEARASAQAGKCRDGTAMLQMDRDQKMKEKLQDNKMMDKH